MADATAPLVSPAKFFSRTASEMMASMSSLEELEQLRETQLDHYAEHKADAAELKADAAEIKAGITQIVHLLEGLGGAPA